MHAKNKEFIRTEIKKLKAASGTHSPSIYSVVADIKGLEVKVDACFLSNPYATDLFMEYFTKAFSDKDSLRRLVEYYPSQNTLLAEVLSPQLQVPAKNIFWGNGAVEIIQAILHRFTKKKILVNTPTFSPYYEFSRPDTEVVFHVLKKENDFRLIKEDYLSELHRHKPDTVVLINPNNPNGGYLSKKELRELLSEMTHVENVLLDESFIHFSSEDHNCEFISNHFLFEEFSNLIIIKSMSKDFGIAGLRAGYAIMAEDKIKQLLKNGFLWNCSGFAEFFFCLFPQKKFQERYEQVRVKFIKETKAFYELLKAIPTLRVYPSQANFFLIELPIGMDADDLALDLLVDHGIYVRSCGDKIGLSKQYVRIASRTHTENMMIAEALSKIITNRH